MFVPIGLLVSLVIISFLLGMAAVPLLVLVILKTPVRMQPKTASEAQNNSELARFK